MTFSFDITSLFDDEDLHYAPEQSERFFSHLFIICLNEALNENKDAFKVLAGKNTENSFEVPIHHFKALPYRDTAVFRPAGPEVAIGVRLSVHPDVGMGGCELRSSGDFGKHFIGSAANLGVDETTRVTHVAYFTKETEKLMFDIYFQLIDLFVSATVKGQPRLKSFNKGDVVYYIPPYRQLTPSVGRVVEVYDQLQVSNNIFGDLVVDWGDFQHPVLCLSSGLLTREEFQAHRSKAVRPTVATHREPNAYIAEAMSKMIELESNR